MALREGLGLPPGDTHRVSQGANSLVEGLRGAVGAVSSALRAKSLTSSRTAYEDGWQRDMQSHASLAMRFGHGSNVAKSEATMPSLVAGPLGPRKRPSDDCLVRPATRSMRDVHAERRMSSPRRLKGIKSSSSIWDSTATPAQVNELDRSTVFCHEFP